MDLSTIPLNFENWGFYDFLLPFILFATIIYAILIRTNIFNTYDEQNKKYINSPVNIIIAFLSSFFITAYTDAGTTISSYLTNTSQDLAYILIGIMSFIFLGSLVGFDLTTFAIKSKKGKDKPITEIFGKVIFTIIIIALITFIFYQFPIFQDTEATNLFWLITIIVALVVLYSLTKKPPKSNQPTKSKGSQNQSQGSTGSQNQGSKTI